MKLDKTLYRIEVNYHPINDSLETLAVYRDGIEDPIKVYFDAEAESFCIAFYKLLNINISKGWSRKELLAQRNVLAQARRAKLSLGISE